MFSVEWLQSAVDELTVIWTRADSVSRRTITSATHRIDEVLRSDPFGNSESRSEGWRIMFESNLGVTFRADTDHQQVRVLHVWTFRTRRA
jgi:hypothetical protein